MSKPRRDQSNGASGSQGDGFLTQSAADYARDFVAQIELGLQCTPKKLPELLLWDERGHHLFTKIMQSEHYPGTRADGEILAEHVEELVDMLGTGGTLVELGAGGMPNTRPILDEICRRGLDVDYIAHDICETAISNSLAETGVWVQDAYPANRVRLEAVTALYEDSFAWLRSRSLKDPRPLVVLWLGNSLSHLSITEFAENMESLIEAVSAPPGLLRRVIISVDGRLDDHSICKSYEAPDGSCSAFVENALQHANRLLENDVFKRGLWHPTMKCLPQEPGIVWTFRSLEHQRLKVASSTVTVRADELIELVTFRRRNEADVCACLEHVGVDIAGIWRHREFDWSLYMLAPKGSNDK